MNAAYTERENKNQHICLENEKNSMVISSATRQQTQQNTPKLAPQPPHSTVKMTTESPVVDNENAKSALQENIESKGKNAYYFAHAHKANGPKWDGKAEPKLLSMEKLSVDEKTLKKSHTSFDYHKSNITAYAFADGTKSVKLYIELDGVGEKCTDEDVTLDSTESSFTLVVKNLKEEDQVLSFGKLTANIMSASYKKQENRIVVTLKKEKEGEWHTVNDKGAPDTDNEIV
ncbi:unnamed protein product [Cylindrotheca closterium]|uniref:CS domain-containing protein n=1 Tax=Cylindrotheca closterium TaxID=2856 RepID=A0AAD2CCD8_9STRA|nr:unnamed protein product [Cylindrotheca closterium]